MVNLLNQFDLITKIPSSKDIPRKVVILFDFN